MAWEERNGRRYYYRKERTPEGVRSVYVGAGPIAELAAEYEEIESLRERLERDRLRLTLAPFDAALSALRNEAAELRTLARAYLVATGHRTHKGQWRRARHLRPLLEELRAESGPLTLASQPHTPQPTEQMARTKKGTSKKKPAPLRAGAQLGAGVGPVFTVPDGIDEKTASLLEEAFEACSMEKPKANDVSALRKVLRGLPASAFEPFAERTARRSAAALLCGEVNTAVAFTENEAERFADELAGPFAGPTVRAAAEHAATSHIVLSAVTDRYGRALRESHTLKLAESYERRMNAAQRRYLRALATVAALRRAEESEAKGAGIATPAERAYLAERVREELARRAKAENREAVLQLPQHAGDSLPAPEEVEMATA